MENLKVGFIGAGGFATFTLYPALHFAPLELQAIQLLLMILTIQKVSVNRVAKT